MFFLFHGDFLGSSLSIPSYLRAGIDLNRNKLTKTKNSIFYVMQYRPIKTLKYKLDKLRRLFLINIIKKPSFRRYSRCHALGLNNICLFMNE
jgi:hypothetical protein